MTPRLTIVLPLKGRHLFTFRFLAYAAKMRLPFRFLLADGQVNDKVAARLENCGEEFPGLEIEYVRYPDDVDFSRYFGKMADAVGRVRTPYVMLADNDDFLARHGLMRVVEFLDAHPDFVSARGHQIGFSVYAGVGAKPGSIHGRFNQMAMDNEFADIDAATPLERLRQGGLCHRLHYAVYRSEALATILREVAEINFSDLMMYEDFVALRSLTLGKAHIAKEAVTYYSQAGTGVSYQPMRDWARHLLRSRFTSDAQALIERIVAAAAGADPALAKAAEETVRALLERRYGDFLASNYGPSERLKSAMRHKWPRVINALQSLPRLSARRQREAILQTLQKVGASADDLSTIREELDVLSFILSPAAFAQYAGPFQAFARSGGTREWV
jgi:glycosyltransferase domain-containing protein